MSIIFHFTASIKWISASMTTTSKLDVNVHDPLLVPKVEGCHIRPTLESSCNGLSGGINVLLSIKNV